MKAADLRRALGARYALPDWCLMFEVANAVGNGSKRYADALAMSLVASRGLALHGFEIKVSRSDLKTELADAAKADSIGRYCDFWWLVVPEGLCGPDELPLRWGLLEFRGGTLRERKPAAQGEPVAYDRPFVAALARRIGQLDGELIGEMVRDQLRPARQRIDLLERELEEEIERRVRARTADYDRLRASMSLFERRSGLSLARPEEAAAIARLANLIQQGGMAETGGWLDLLQDDLQQAMDRLEAFRRGLRDEDEPAPRRLQK